MRGDVARWKRYQEKTSADGTRRRADMTDWEIYTDGPDGEAFKFPWEVAPTDKTAFGHIIPAAVMAALYLLPLAYGKATGAF